MDYQFICETSSGYAIKTLIEGLQECITNETVFILSEEGISSSRADGSTSILASFKLEAKKFDQYQCDEPRKISLSLRDFQSFLKNIKKKDSLRLCIEASQPDYLCITPLALKSERITTHRISIRDVSDEEYQEIKGYHEPKVISTSEFQKMCKDISIVPYKHVNIWINKQYYARFFTDITESKSTNSEFGEIRKKDSETYKNVFYSKMITQLSKFTSLHNKIRISAPRDSQNPIKFSISIADLGEIDIFIKDQKSIDFEKQNQN